jgi:hypothetical protein
MNSVAILLKPEPDSFTSYNTRKGLGSLSLCAIVLRSSPPSHVSTFTGQRSSQLFCVHYTFRQRTAKCRGGDDGPNFGRRIRYTLIGLSYRTPSVVVIHTNPRRNGGMIISMQKRRTLEENFSSATSPPTMNFAWRHPHFKPGI